MANSDKHLSVYISTWLGDGDMIHHYAINRETGELSHISSIDEGMNCPAYIATDPKKRTLYVTNTMETEEFNEPEGISAYEIDSDTGELAFLNFREIQGNSPCYICVTRNGKFVLSANYTSGSLSVIPANADGSLDECRPGAQHEPGTGPNAQRQEGPHVHSLVLDPAGQFAFASDLGLDEIKVYEVDAEGGRLSSREDLHITAAPGAGPRHFTFHPNSHFAYGINELDNTINVFAYDGAGGLATLQTLSTLPDDFTSESYAADIHVHPSGRFLYGSNRGYDSIVIMGIDPATGLLTRLGLEPTQGDFPRSFTLDPAGEFLIAANEHSDTVLVFRINPQTGGLKQTGQPLAVRKPACVICIER